MKEKRLLTSNDCLFLLTGAEMLPATQPLSRVMRHVSKWKKCGRFRAGTSNDCLFLSFRCRDAAGVVAAVEFGEATDG